MKTLKPKNQKNGFTLVEIMVVITITGLILPIFFNIVSTLVRLQTQISHLQRLKETGDYISSQISHNVRQYAVRIDDDTCSTIFSSQVSDATASLFFVDKADKCFGYYSKDNNFYLIAEPEASVEDTTLIDKEDDDISISVESESLKLTRLESDLASIRFNLVSNPKVSYLKPQSLSYQFYVYIRH